MPVAADGAGRPWIRITKDGRRAVHQPADRDGSGLDPFRARPRLAQIYDHATRTVLVIDLLRVPIDVLKALEGRRLIIHNSAFELAMLGAQGIQLRNTYCTLLMARLALGAERGGLKLADVAAEFLDGLELPKVEQVSDWAAERLSEHQLAYAALDAAVAHMLARPLWGELDGGARQAFKVGNATVPAVASMRLAGIPFDVQTHEATIAGWERSYVEARDSSSRSRAATSRPRARSARRGSRGGCRRTCSRGGRGPRQGSCAPAAPTSSGWRPSRRSGPCSR